MRWHRTRVVALSAVVTSLMAAMTALWIARPPRAPVVVALRIQVHDATVPQGRQRIAITNHSEHPIVLSDRYLLNYSARSAPGDRHSIEACPTAVTRLAPGEGFVQEVTPFPSADSVWQFEISAATDSMGLNLGRSLESFLHRAIRLKRYPLTGRAFRRFVTAWQASPS